MRRIACTTLRNGGRAKTAYDLSTSWETLSSPLQSNITQRCDNWMAKGSKMTNDQWFAVVMIAVSAFLGWCVCAAVYDIALWGAV